MRARFSTQSPRPPDDAAHSQGNIRLFKMDGSNRHAPETYFEDRSFNTLTASGCL